MRLRAQGQRASVRGHTHTQEMPMGCQIGPERNGSAHYATVHVYWPLTLGVSDSIMCVIKCEYGTGGRH